MSEKLVTIYALCEPDTNDVRYVGKAIDLKSRIRGHRWEAKNNKLHTRKANWLRSLQGRDPTVIILAEIVDWEESERYWIAEMRRRGCDLTNYADGGQTSPVEGKGHSEATKKRMSEEAIKRGARPPSRKGTKSSEETRSKLRAAVKKRGCKPPLMGGWNKGVKKTHCKNGHGYSPENTRIVVRRNQDRSYQVCKICERQQ